MGINNLVGMIIDNDEFFHITCHMDGGTRNKIERGEFIDLEKLLTRDRFRSGRNDENRLEFYNKDGYTYLVPANHDNRITNVRKWEQAFRVYAAIYSKANPHRAAEIWQYVYGINTVANS